MTAAHDICDEPGPPDQVAGLIAALSGLDPDAVVYVDAGDGELRDISYVECYDAADNMGPFCVLVLQSDL